MVSRNSIRLHAILRLLILALLLGICAASAAQNNLKSRAGQGITLSDDSYKVYPNPSAGRFTVQVKEQTSAYDVNVYNLIGELVFHWESNDAGAAEVEVNLVRHPRGLYFVELDTDRGNLLRRIILGHEKEN